MIEKWGESIAFKALLIDLSKAFPDCVPHELLIAKLYTNGFDMKSLNLIHDFLSNKIQRLKVGGENISWQVLLDRALEGSIVGLLLFNFFLWDLFYFFKGTDMTCFVDNTKPCNANVTQQLVINYLEK